MERNADKIKRLENELGRYRKKVTDQENILGHMRKKLEQVNEGSRETQMLVDAVLTAAVLSCGCHVTDEETGESLGHRLTLPKFSVKEIREKYEIHARRDEQDGSYVLGVVPRVAADDPA